MNNSLRVVDSSISRSEEFSDGSTFLETPSSIEYFDFAGLVDLSIFRWRFEILNFSETKAETKRQFAQTHKNFILITKGILQKLCYNTHWQTKWEWISWKIIAYLIKALQMLYSCDATQHKVFNTFP